jgi:galactose mutarotase-like enzyme
MMLLQAWAQLSDGRETPLLDTPAFEEAARRLNAGGQDDFAGNLAFSFGGAILAPYANRIQGQPLADAREIEANIAGRHLRLPRNWGGRRANARQYAMHGLILDRAFQLGSEGVNHVTGQLDDETFAGRWPSRWSLEVRWRLADGALDLDIAAHNRGDIEAPMGLGWHPWFKVLSGERRTAALRIPADARTEVGDYDEVLPTGSVLPVEGTPYDFRAGRRLADLSLDDCFVGLKREMGELKLQLHDPVAKLTLELESPSSAIGAVQVYAPLDRPVVVIEPQFNWPDPFSPVWNGAFTGMAPVKPGERARYQVRLRLT